MSLFDLVFIVFFLAAISTLIRAAWFALRREHGRARRILLKLATGITAYMAVVVATSLLLPRRSFHTGELQCFDDWCIAMTGFSRAPAGNSTAYTSEEDAQNGAAVRTGNPRVSGPFGGADGALCALDLRLSSRARRISQRENNMAVYLRDDRGRRYDPVARPSDTPFHVLLQPRESVVVSRAFLVPGDAAHLGAVITHEGGFPIGWFIIGYDTWFRKPPIVTLQ